MFIADIYSKPPNRFHYKDKEDTILQEFSDGEQSNFLRALSCSLNGAFPYVKIRVKSSQQTVNSVIELLKSFWSPLFYININQFKHIDENILFSAVLTTKK